MKEKGEKSKNWLFKSKYVFQLKSRYLGEVFPHKWGKLFVSEFRITNKITKQKKISHHAYDFKQTHLLTDFVKN